VLPIAEFLPQISASLAAAPNLVLQAEPGAGKSTALPLSLLEANWLEGKRILMLEPRRVAAKSIAHYLAAQLGESVGQRIGYQIKNERKVSANTQLEIVTEGILTRRLQSDPELKDIGLIIFDEFHERSLHGDLALLLSLEVQQSLRDDLKLLVMSATIDTQQLSEYLDGAAIISCPGRGFPIDISYQPAKPNARLSDQVSAALSHLFNQQHQGDVLVFLPGQGDILRCIEAAEALFDSAKVELLPLYGALPLAQQEAAIRPNKTTKQRIIFSTNIAETSLTIEGITAVVDSGLERVLSYDPTAGMTRLETAYISKASATQRAGRAGRTQAGKAVRLWSEEKQRSLKEFQSEEILGADLSNTLLELMQWGETDFSQTNWLTKPPKAHLAAAIDNIEMLGLCTPEHRLSELGKQATPLGLEPRLAAMLLSYGDSTSQLIACDLAALLSERDLFHSSHSVDINERLIALQDFKANPKAATASYPIKRSVATQVIKSAKSYARLLGVANGASYTLTDIHQITPKLLLSAYPDRLAKARQAQGTRYQLANGRGAFLNDTDPLCRAAWLIVCDADAQKREGRIYSACTIELATIKTLLATQFKNEERFTLDTKTQTISGESITCYRALTITSQRINDIPKDALLRCVKELLKSGGLATLNWTEQCDNWLQRATWLGKVSDRFPSINSEYLINQVDNWLIPYAAGVTSIAKLKKLNIFELMTGILTWEEQQFLAAQAPERYTTPSGKNITIRYDEQQGPTVSVQLQEMFGQLESPVIGDNSTPIRFELLSPARRPIQTTSDLGNFWISSYFEVAKDMKGRYPKHRWPDEPLLEKPGRSIKRK